jgi:alpha-ketoglutarate-dependent taurine dioxygenase
MAAPLDVTVRVADEKRNLPLLIESRPGLPEMGLDAFISWYRDNHNFVETKLSEHGAILFRGFGIRSPSAFAGCVKSISDDLLDYIDGNSPRTKLGNGIYTSTEYPPEFFISLHNELSYSSHFPKRLVLCCIVAPRSGGETVIADSRAILKSLPAEIVEAFTKRQVKYIRNLHGGRGYGLSWQDTFETTDKAAVERFCKDASIDYEWRADGGLRLVQIGPGVMRHPKTNEQAWFNQADQFHPSNNPREVYQGLKVIHKGMDELLPQTACFGDGTPIEDSMLALIRDVAREQMVCLPWREGDVMIVDNILVCHGRMPYSGPRRILISMI